LKKCLIIGGGFAGCSMAHQLQLQGNWDVTIIEAGPFLGAGVRTHWWGGHPYTFGPRHFLTKNEVVYNYLNTYLPLRLCSEHEFISFVESDSSFYNFPINTGDIPKMPHAKIINEELKLIRGQVKSANLEEYWINSVGPTLYSKFIETYSKKMWQVESNTDLDTFDWSPKGTPLKSGPRAAWDTAISAYPWASNGYNDYFEIAAAEANVILSTRIEKYELEKKQVFFSGQWHKYDLIVSTVSPDQLFDNLYGELPFVGRDIYKFVLPVENAFPENVYFVYYVNDEPFTRIVEYKKFTLHKSSSTLLALEIPSKNGKHYPLPIRKWQAVADNYLKALPEGVFSIGRAGSYRYEVDIDDCIEQSMDVASKIL
jgi:UDP-galactopyranose mutase